MRKQITIPLEVPYHTLGKLTEQTQYVWVVCHGYGQLAEFFIKNFECLNLDEHFIIAPQGLSRFYLRAFTGRVGATWMTSYDREMEMENYIRMLDYIYQEEIAHTSHSFKTVLLGFSQGAATISRWAMHGQVEFDALNLWGGRFPPEIEPHVALNKLAGKHFSIYIGNQDKYIDAKQREEQKLYMSKKGLHPEIHVYEGEHKIYDEPLLELAASV